MIILPFSDSTIASLSNPRNDFASFTILSIGKVIPHFNIKYSITGTVNSKTVVLAKFVDLKPNSSHSEQLLNIAEMLGALLFQTLPRETLRRYLPESVEIEYPNVHLNVLSHLLQTRDGNISREDMEAALGSLTDSNDPFIQNYFLEKARDNPLVIAVSERAREMRSGESLPCETLPNTTKQYPARNGVPDQASAEKSKSSSQTFREFIILFMSDSGRATQAAQGHPSLAQIGRKLRAWGDFKVLNRRDARQQTRVALEWDPLE